MSVGIGLQAKKLNNDNHLVYTLHGDGELQEGQNWEAIMYASKKVDNLIATIDLNGKQIDGATDEVLPMGSIRAKFEAGMTSRENKHRSYYSWNDGSKSRKKENQFACYCILKWGMGGFHDEYSCLAWKST
jgi:transketolase N-terminal domain/subunit